MSSLGAPQSRGATNGDLGRRATRLERGGWVLGAALLALAPQAAASVGTSIVLGTTGALVLAVTMGAKLLRMRAARALATSDTKMRVLFPDEAARGRTTFTGIARRACADIASGLSEEPCLLFGVRGELQDAVVADADGGDFDLELPSGEHVMISLEHAMLLDDAPACRIAPLHEIGSALVELLERRGIGGAGQGQTLEEHLVRDGDEVTVTGTLLGGTVTALGSRGRPGPRVLAGDADRPLVVRPSTRGK